MTETFIDIKQKACKKILEDLDFQKEMSDEEIYDVIDNTLIDITERQGISLDEIILLRKEIFNSLKKFDVIQEFLDDEEVTEIMINGPDSIFVEKKGAIRKTEKSFESREKLEDVIQHLVADCNRTVNEASPIQDARLEGARVNIVLPPVALNGPIVTIRRFPDNPITMEKLIDLKSINREAADFLKLLVEAKYNIFISGGTGSGKTTFLNALSQFIPKDERIITIEDSAELRILGVENLVRLETRNKNFEDCKPITIRDLIRTALRMRPDRVIVGEVRGAEAVDMLAAMNTGHDGSLSTGHGNTTKDMLSRLETMVLTGLDIPLYAVRGQIAGGIDILVHLGRLKDKRRVVLEIAEIKGLVNGEIELNKLFVFNGKELIKVNELINTGKLDGLRNIQVVS